MMPMRQRGGSTMALAGTLGLVMGCQGPAAVPAEPVATPTVEVAAPSASAEVEEETAPALTAAAGYDVDGIRLGDRYARVMARAPYDEPCDDDAIDGGARHFMVYGGRDCRGRAFPERTTLMFYVAHDESGSLDRPIEAMGSSRRFRAPARLLRQAARVRCPGRARTLVACP